MIDKTKRDEKVNAESKKEEATMAEQLSKTQLEINLKQFIGTTQYHRTGFKTLATDGAKYLAEEASAYWLLDIIDSVAPFNDFAICKLTVTEDEKGRRGKVLIDSGHDPKEEKENYQLFHTQDIPFTDFPLDEITLYIQDSEHGPVILLPSEY